MIAVPMSTTIELPTNVAVCPICGGRLVVHVDEVQEDYDGTWRAMEDSIYSSCITEPDFSDLGYEAWHDGHFPIPPIDWLPVDKKIADWLDDNYRFTSPDDKKEKRKNERWRKV